MGIGLYDYQLDAVERLKRGSILCGGVGSGKSRTSLAYYWKCCGGDIYSNEYKSLTLTPIDLYIITTARKRDSKEWESELAPFHLSPYEGVGEYNSKVVIDSWNNIAKYANVKNSFFIFDEQRVVGWGKWSKTFIQIASKNHWILLSATPGDTWMDYIPVFVANGFYRNKSDFTQRHVVWSRFSKYPKVNKFLDTGILTKHRNDILVDMSFSRKTVSHHIDIPVEYDRQMYKLIYKQRWNPFTDEPVKQASELCYTLRHVVNSDPSRILSVLEIIEKAPRVIIFYNFDYELEELRNIQYGSDTRVAEWNGHKHQMVPDCNRWVYLVQYAAGSEAWNCITTNTIIFYSQNYSYKVMQQASGRIDRANTPYKDLYYYHLKSSAPIDIAIARAIKEKKMFNESRFIEKGK